MPKMQYDEHGGKPYDRVYSWRKIYYAVAQMQESYVQSSVQGGEAELKNR